MNRAAWKSVVITGAVLGAASLATLANRIAGRGALAALERLARASRALLDPGRAHTPGAGSPTLLIATAAALALAAAILLLVRRLTRTARQRVLALAAGGLSAPHIARRMGLAQDAVRAYLRTATAPRPAFQGRKALPAGRNVRPAPERRRAVQPPKWLKKRATTALGRAMFARHSGC